MTPRKKKGLGFIITGVVFAVVGVITMTTEVTPQWVQTGLYVVSAIANVVGLVVLIPSED